MSDSVATEQPQAPEGDSSGSSQRRLIVLVVGLAALLVVGLGAYFLFLSGGSDDEDFEVIRSAPAPVETDAPKGDKKDDTVPTKIDDDIEVGRDPFKPLPQEAVKQEPVTVDDTDPVDDGAVIDNGGSGTGGTQPTKAPTVNPTPSPSPTETKDPDVVTSYKVTLRSVDVKKDSAVIEVNGKRYVVKVGKLFTSTTQGPFKLTRVAELPNGKDTANVRFGADAPVELIEKDKTVFQL